MNANNLRVGCIGYLNSMPFYHNLNRSGYQIQNGSPAEIMDLFRAGKADVGLLPMAGLFDMGSGFAYLDNWGIAAKQRAISVLLFSHIPVQKANSLKVKITTETVTSSRLLEILFADWWQVDNPIYVDSDAESDAVLLIGDAALREVRGKNYKYRYDLVEAWNDLTGLPFVFARWAVRDGIPHAAASDFSKNLSDNFKNNMSSVGKLISKREFVNISADEAKQYIENFVYDLDEQCLQGATEFQKRATNQHKLVR